LRHGSPDTTRGPDSETSDRLSPPGLLPQLECASRRHIRWAACLLKICPSNNKLVGGGFSLLAATFAEYGPPENLTAAERPRPTSGAGELLVRVAAARVNPIDSRIRSVARRTGLPRNGNPSAPNAMMGCRGRPIHLPLHVGPIPGSGSVSQQNCSPLAPREDYF
jgi:hypothetical protein